MLKKILILGAGKSATSLINYLIQESATLGWRIIVADSDLALAQAKTGNAPFAEARCIDIRDPGQRRTLIGQADLVIALLPPPLVPLVAADCAEAESHLITASYLDQELKSLQNKIVESGILVLGEMGLDPGIDHMSALAWIDQIRGAGGRILSFRSHCGGLVSPQSDDNPWRYKVSWNPRNIILAGSMGAAYKENSVLKEVDYPSLFKQCEQVVIPSLGQLAYYPNRDSLSYQTAYGLQEAETFLRTTLRYPAFCHAWYAVVRAGLTRTDQALAHPVSFKEWSDPVHPFVTAENREQLQYLGLFDETPVPFHLHSAADVVQFLFEKRLALQEGDKDMIVMLHQITYELNNKHYRVESLLIVHGKNSLETAMAQTVGLPLGIAAKLILQDKIKLRGLHIPVHKEIYEPVLRELAAYGILFQDTVEECVTISPSA